MTTRRRYWFGPRKYGWGWTPLTWEGWLVTAAAVVTSLVAIPSANDRWGPGPALAVTLGTVAVVTAVAAITGTAPGGAEEWKRLEAQRRSVDVDISGPSSVSRALSAEEVRRRMSGDSEL